MNRRAMANQDSIEPTAPRRSWLQHLSAVWNCSLDPAEPRFSWRRCVCFTRRLTDAFSTHQCSLMACACAYCTLLSLVPLLVIGISVLGFVLGGNEKTLREVQVALRGYAPH